ncbi:aminotransferase class I/II-fold pyridoxal phosphate-dependent enzyme [Parasphaerochaeta coccoides]|uniref:Aminotransferase class I and II n=1 Tax=Parasphaerochaeta coccoides (strain ATCC BAA-1237 / DSM 17374 / SPN1) TaxID=760011 RepID=F4GLU6_PARC1|nr:aminotransferase class I/II-fold pyridoxal phosphate-dependent enzyme [Parasphaerochaeta coccoides]AEC02987.1 aminotransferase class I and II [Parasphaerochaeta coccoides DSM 17374]
MNAENNMTDIAGQLNENLSETVVFRLLSSFGRRIYFPRGIVFQSVEAGRLAYRYNATAGVAMQDGQPMYLSEMYNAFDTEVYEPRDIFSYAPTGGDAQARSLWHQRLLKNNPALHGIPASVPMVTAALTHALSLAARLFVDEGDAVVVPSLRWDNYDLIFGTGHGAVLHSFPLFSPAGEFNVPAMMEAIHGVEASKVILILNFPNNPTGYTPPDSMIEDIARTLSAVAAEGKDLLVICDDAYHGLFYEDGIGTNSLFAHLADAHPNLLAIKCDGPTKEDLLWGFRLGFITCACKGLPRPAYEALEQKLLGAIRCSVSSSQRPGQSILIEALTNGTKIDQERDAAREEMRCRYQAARDALAKHVDDNILTPFPFNSGYFFAFKCNVGKVDAETLRRRLLESYGAGTVSLAIDVLRVAYCSVPREGIPLLVDMIYQAAHEISAMGE